MNPRNRLGQSAVAQDKQVLRQPNNPQIIQAKMPTAPSVYRPQSIPKCLQTKMAVGHQTSTGRPGQLPGNNSIQRTTPSAPPIYRPQQLPRVLQGKMDAKAQLPFRQNSVQTVALNKSGQLTLSRVIQRANGGAAPALVAKSLAEVEGKLDSEFKTWSDAVTAVTRSINAAGELYNTGYGGPGQPNQAMSKDDHTALVAKWVAKDAKVNGVTVIYRTAMSGNAKLAGATVHDFLCKKRTDNGGTDKGGFNFHIGVIN